MSPTDEHSPENFYVSLILPLKRHNDRHGIHYFSQSPDKSVASYWQKVSSCTGGMTRVPASDADNATLLNSLNEYWQSMNDQTLVKLASALKALQESMTKGEAPKEDVKQEVSDFVYPLF